NTAAATTSAYNAGVAAGTANTAAATSGAYNAGVAAGSANTAAAYNAGLSAGSVTTTGATPAPAAGSAFAMGGIYSTLPAGCISPSVQGNTYYLSGNTWFQPSYGANGVNYRVVPAP